MMKAVDKLGRMLFIFWYRGDKIKERFDVTDFAETEDLLKDTFKNLGKVVLDLKRKYTPTE